MKDFYTPRITIKQPYLSNCTHAHKSFNWHNWSRHSFVRLKSSYYALIILAAGQKAAAGQGSLLFQICPQ